MRHGGWIARHRVNLPQPRFEPIPKWKIQPLPQTDCAIGTWTGMPELGDLARSTVEVADETRVFESSLVIGTDGAENAVTGSSLNPAVMRIDGRPGRP